jgi:SAM-dependent methyltransferase
VLSTTSRTPALAELHRVLRPDGRLLVSDIQAEPAAVSSLADHPILGAALCVTDSWRKDEFETRAGAAGFVVERHWDRSSAILDLVDRAEARIGLAAIASRDLGLNLASIGGLVASTVLGGLGPADARRLASEVRDAVGRSEVGYFAAVARRSDAPMGVMDATASAGPAS